jgi:hypothetical protein
MMRYQKSIPISRSRKNYGQHGTLGGETILSQQVCPNQISSTRWLIGVGIMSFVMHEFVYFGRSIPWIIIDAIPYFRRYKLQDVTYLLLFIH